MDKDKLRKHERRIADDLIVSYLPGDAYVYLFAEVSGNDQVVRLGVNELGAIQGIVRKDKGQTTVKTLVALFVAGAVTAAIISATGAPPAIQRIATLFFGIIGGALVMWAVERREP